MRCGERCQRASYMNALERRVRVILLDKKLCGENSPHEEFIPFMPIGDWMQPHHIPYVTTVLLPMLTLLSLHIVELVHILYYSLLLHYHLADIAGVELSATSQGSYYRGSPTQVESGCMMVGGVECGVNKCC